MAGQSQMSELYLDCPELNLVDLELNYLSSLDFSNCTKLTTLNIAQNKITHLDLQCPDLDLLRCESNNLTALDVSNCPKFRIVTYVYRFELVLITLEKIQGGKIRQIQT